jgi:hypothetical protein
MASYGGFEQIFVRGFISQRARDIDDHRVESMIEMVRISSGRNSCYSQIVSDEAR